MPWPRNERGATAGLKTISYAENVRALAFAHERGATEAVFANTRGDLCEATGSNVFLVLDGVACTPPAAAGCLLGVTRALVLELGASAGVPVEERDVPLEALLTAEEAFLTSSTARSPPIAAVDGAGSGRAGCRTPRPGRGLRRAGGVESRSVSDRRCTTSPTATTTGTARRGRDDEPTGQRRRRVATPSMRTRPELDAHRAPDRGQRAR